MIYDYTKQPIFTNFVIALTLISVLVTYSILFIMLFLSPSTILKCKKWFDGNYDATSQWVYQHTLKLQMCLKYVNSKVVKYRTFFILTAPVYEEVWRFSVLGRFFLWHEIFLKIRMVLEKPEKFKFVAPSVVLHLLFFSLPIGLNTRIILHSIWNATVCMYGHYLAACTPTTYIDRYVKENKDLCGLPAKHRPVEEDPPCNGVVAQGLSDMFSGQLEELAEKIAQKFVHVFQENTPAVVDAFLGQIKDRLSERISEHKPFMMMGVKWVAVITVITFAAVLAKLIAKCSSIRKYLSQILGAIKKSCKILATSVASWSQLLETLLGFKEFESSEEEDDRDMEGELEEEKEDEDVMRVAHKMPVVAQAATNSWINLLSVVMKVFLDGVPGTYNGVMEMLKDSMKVASTLTFSITSVFGVLTEAFKLLSSYIKTPRFLRSLVSYPRVLEMSSELDDINADITLGKTIINHDLVTEIGTYLDEARKLSTKIPRSSPEVGLLNLVLKQAQTMRDLCLRHTAERDQRDEPLAVLLVGKPGIGKSVVSRLIANALAVVDMPDRKLELFRRDPENYVYNMTMGAKYMDGLTPTMRTTIIDDCFMKRDTPNSESGPTSFLPLINVCPVIANKADLSEKGMMVGLVNFVCSTNLMSIDVNTFPSMQDMDALKRRFQFKYMVAVAPEYAVDANVLPHLRKKQPIIEERVVCINEFYEWDWDRGTYVNQNEPLRLPEVLRRLRAERRRLNVASVETARIRREQVDMLVEEQRRLNEAERRREEALAFGAEDAHFLAAEVDEAVPLVEAEEPRDFRLGEAFLNYILPNRENRVEVQMAKKDEVISDVYEFAEYRSVEPNSRECLQQAHVYLREWDSIADSLKKRGWGRIRMTRVFMYLSDTVKQKYPDELPLVSSVSVEEFQASMGMHEWVCVKTGELVQKFLRKPRYVQIVSGLAALIAAATSTFALIQVFGKMTETLLMDVVVPHSGQNNVVSLSHTQKRNLRKKKKREKEQQELPVHTQMAEYDIHAKIIKNVVFIYLNDKPSMHALGIQNDIMLVNKHFSSAIRDSDRITFCWDNVKETYNGRDVRTKFLTGEEDGDYLFIKGIFHLKFPKIKKHFVQKGDVEYLSKNNPTMLEAIFIRDGIFHIRTCRTAMEEMEYTDNLGKRYNKHNFVYAAATYSGMCGLPILCFVNGTYRVLGIHAAGNQREIAVGQIIYRRFFTDLPEYIVKYDEALKAQAATHNTERNAKGVGVPIAECRKVNIPTTSKLKLSSLSRDLRRSECVFKENTYVPSTMTLRAMRNGLEYLGTRDLHNFPQAMVDDLRSILTAELRQIGSKATFGVYSWRTAIDGYFRDSDGVKGAPLLPPLNRKTSAGFPTTWINDEPGKHCMLGKEDEIDFSNPLLCAAHERLQKLLHDIRNGVHPVQIAVPMLKDEALPLRKKGTARIFYCSDFVFNVLIRMYFGDAIRALSDKRAFIRNGSAVGVNMYREVDQLVAHLRGDPKLNNLLAIDYKKMDLNCSPQMLRTAYTIMAELYEEQTEDDRLVREYIMEQLCAPYISYNGSIIRLEGVNLSGVPTTVHVNGLVNQMYLRLAVIQYQLTEEEFINHRMGENELLVLLRGVKYLTFGDDALISLPEDLKHLDTKYLALALQEYGVKITNADKTDPLVIAHPQCDITRVDFLQRTFRDEGGYYCAPLNLKSIAKSLHWTRSSGTREAFGEVINIALQELSLHGKEVFEANAPALLSVVRKSDFEPVHISYEACRKVILSLEAYYC